MVLHVTSEQGESTVHVRYSGCDHNGFDDGVTVRRLTRDAMQPLLAGPNRLFSFSGRDEKRQDQSQRSRDGIEIGRADRKLQPRPPALPLTPPPNRAQILLPSAPPSSHLSRVPSSSLTFADRDSHRAWLATQAALPAGFRVGTTAFDFMPREAPVPSPEPPPAVRAGR